ncbi:intra-flagellar transport protein 57 [Phlyctochytrium arcticum]|nr:intra-flagellar transport protein 57 [Phlyctochytrium arcticum]
MDDILDKLKVLNYLAEFCKPMNINALHRFYFVSAASNSNEQFYHFASLFTWLVKKNGETFEAPGQFDDPNATATNIATKLKEMDIPFDHGIAKLKQGYGDAILGALQALVDRALVKSGFVFQPPIHKVDEYAEEAEVDADAEVTAETIEEDVPALDDEDEIYVHTAGRQEKTEQIALTIKDQSPKPKVDPADWKLEVERVTPMLRVQIPDDNKDWRIHVVSMKHHQNTITGSLSETENQLNKLHNDIEKTLEKITSREKYINSQFETQTEEHRVLQDQISVLKQKYGVASTNVTELTNQLSSISEELDGVKTQMDDIGSGMTDSKPLVNIKQGVVKLKAEIKQMDLRLGVIQQTLLHAKLKTKGPIGAGPADSANMMQVNVVA